MAQEQKLSPVTVENARIMFRNFSGKEGQYNREGDRNFSVVLPQDVADQMANDGWNIRVLPIKEEGDEAVFYLPVSVSYKNRPPRVVMITSSGRTPLDEDTIEALDYADIENVDIVVNPYFWTVRENSGIKAYLKTMFITIQEDELERKYAIRPTQYEGEE